jgi:hypothetical protein
MRSFVLALLTAALALGPAPAGAAGVSFDRFLSGQDRACTDGPEFRAFRRSLIRIYGAERPKPAKPTLPAEIEPAIRSISMEEKNDHLVVTVVVEGTFRGLALSRIVVYIGKENGIAGHAFEFSASPEAVKKTFAAAVAAGAEKMAATSQIGASTGLDLRDGRAALWCDYSN